MYFNINKIFVGLKILQYGEPCVVINYESVKPGKGRAFSRIRFKQMISGKIFSRTFKSGEYLEKADVIETDMIYLYNDKNCYYFMNSKNFEQIVVNENIIKLVKKWLVENTCYVITLWNDNPILVTPPIFVELKVIKTIPIAKGNSVSPETKLATLNTGAIIKVPLFIQSGELVKVNTNSSEYVSRIKNIS